MSPAANLFILGIHVLQPVGLGLAVVARIVEQLGGQLRVDSKIGEGSRFSFLIPFSTEIDGTVSSASASSSASVAMSRRGSHENGPRGDEISNLVHALSSTHLTASPRRKRIEDQIADSAPRDLPDVEKTDKLPSKSMLGLTTEPPEETVTPSVRSSSKQSPTRRKEDSNGPQLRILIVEVCHT